MGLTATAILGGASALANVVGAIGGAIGNARARREQAAQRRAMEARQRSIYERDYYGDFTRNADVQNMLSRMREEMGRQSQIDRNRAVITGASTEASSRAKESQNRAIGRYMGDLAGQSFYQKQRATDRYLNGMAGVDNLNYSALENRAMSGSNLMYNGLKGIASMDWAGLAKAFGGGGGAAAGK